MTDEKQIRSEACRRAVLAVLHASKSGAFHADEIRTVYLSRHGYTLAEVEDALQTLALLELVKLIPDPLGSSKAAQISGKGILFHERGGEA